MRTARSPLARPLPMVLLVDQDDDNRAMYGQYMKAANWIVEEAADGREALAKALALRPELIVTEIRLPGIDGFELCKLLRRDFATRSIPIVVVTGDAYPRDLKLALNAGATSVLLKPCVCEAVLAEAVRLLEAAREPGASPAPAAPPPDTEPREGPLPARLQVFAGRRRQRPQRGTVGLLRLRTRVRHVPIPPAHAQTPQGLVGGSEDRPLADQRKPLLPDQEYCAFGTGLCLR